jgi:hypothetical protein
LSFAAQQTRIKLLHSCHVYGDIAWILCSAASVLRE